MLNIGKKRPVELIFHLQWQNRPEVMTVMGMIDPGSNPSFETFKAYLGKNSGVAFDDVQVIFVVNNDKSSDSEWLIDSQTMFEFAMWTFRLKAKLKEPIVLKLQGKTKENRKQDRKGSTDVETQVSGNPNEIFTKMNAELPPVWFIRYMEQYKKEIIEEATYSILNAKYNAAHGSSLKKKVEMVKRPRHSHIESTEKELRKTLKHDRKLEIKLDKLDAKTKKIKEKKAQLLDLTVQKDSGKGDKNDNEIVDIDGRHFLNATPLDGDESIPHFIGGEQYTHKWKVLNNGKITWTNETKLCLAWGSLGMPPVEKVIQCPMLKPGESGYIMVQFQIPSTPGRYESYWNFYENEFRFGHWLKCTVIVDPKMKTFFLHSQEEAVQPKPEVFDDEAHRVEGEPYNEFHIIKQLGYQEAIIKEEMEKRAIEKLLPTIDNNLKEYILAEAEAQTSTSHSNNREVKIEVFEERNDGNEVAGNLENMRLEEEAHSSSSSESDNQSIISLSETRRSSSEEKINEDFIVVKMPTGAQYIKSPNKYGIAEEELIVNLSKKDEANAADNKNEDATIVECGEKSEGETKVEEAASNESEVKIDENLEEETGYVYVIVEGKKLPLPKSILNAEYLATAETAPVPKKSEGESIGQAIEANVVQEDRKIQPDAIECSGDAGHVFYEVTRETFGKSPSQVSAEILRNEVAKFEECFNNGQSPVDDGNENKAARLFVFPQGASGFEVVHPVKEVKASMSAAQTSYDISRLEEIAQEASNLPFGNAYVPTAPKCETFMHVPNFQQSGAAMKLRKEGEQQQPEQEIKFERRQSTATTTSDVASNNGYILSENLVAGAVNVASSAINTAKSVLSLITPSSTPKPEVDCNFSNMESKRRANLTRLVDMGFCDIEEDMRLLAYYNDDLHRVILELLR